MMVLALKCTNAPNYFLVEIPKKEKDIDKILTLLF